ncbi:Archaeal ATPase-domain-containing protein [Glomus cerebriforme]|uniref:Archaeal ATPase-domain-containing protein n=1 Tax=Glomus cerebriforme TaxID=658196 RepID=A0A397SWV2_9GLOM|nr:Archaeal ATPase-domain-containing protein [Glomus cerebriforme]
MMKNSLSIAQKILVQPHTLQRKSFPISYTILSRNISIIGILKPIITPLSSFLSQSPQKATQELETQALETYEKIKFPITHTFNRTPKFLGREKEIRMLNDSLSGDPKFLIINGSQSVGKTALLREVLANNKYHVIYIDLRISGFADLRSFTAEFATHLETFFTQITSYYPNLKIFQDKALVFKKLRLSGPESFDVKQLLDSQTNIDLFTIQNRNDFAKLMKSFQSGLLMYHETDLDEKKERDEEDERQINKKDKHRIFDYEKSARQKRIPIVVFDEAHKLKNLLNDNEALQILFDALVAFTTQDRLCHVIHSTSNSFYERLLTKSRILHHTKSLIIGDLSKLEISKYFHEILVPIIPQEIRERIFKMEDDLHEILGGKILYWKSFVQDYILSDGKLTIESFEPFIRAQHQLNLYLKDSPSDDELIPVDPIIRISHYIIDKHKVSYHRLCKEFTQPVIDALIDNGILEYRMINEIGDVDDEPEEKPFVIPSSQLMKHAMKVLIKNGNVNKDITNIPNEELKK